MTWQYKKSGSRLETLDLKFRKDIRWFKTLRAPKHNIYFQLTTVKEMNSTKVVSETSYLDAVNSHQIPSDYRSLKEHVTCGVKWLPLKQ